MERAVCLAANTVSFLVFLFVVLYGLFYLHLSRYRSQTPCIPLVVASLICDFLSFTTSYCQTSSQGQIKVTSLSPLRCSSLFVWLSVSRQTTAATTYIYRVL